MLGNVTTPQKYWAFLSYSHADAASAARLHRALERYVIPRRLRRAQALPRRLQPVFRDVDELTAGASLDTRLRDALDQSRWLIVLCSAAACESRYVASEIQHFLARFGPDRVLCVLLEGEIAGHLPQPLRDLQYEPLAADLRPGTDAETATLRLIAAMAGLGFAQLRERDALRRRLLRRLAVAAVAVAILAGATWWELFQHDTVEYYAAYVRRDGIWVGLDPVQAVPTAGYRFIRKGRLGTPRRVDYVDSEGQCPPGGMDSLLAERPGGPKDFCTAGFDYTSGGALAREDDYAELGEAYAVVLGSLRYSENLAQVITQGAPGTHPRLHFIRFTRDARGRDVELRFMSTPGVPSPDRRGNYGYALAYDVAGHLTNRTALGSESRPKR